MHNSLHNWDNSLNTAQHDRLDALLSRREFLTRSLKTAGSVAILPTLPMLPACSEERAQLQISLPQTEPWATFAAVQLRLFPADGNGPSAADINATLYLKFVLDAKDTDPEERDFIYKGIGWLKELAQQQQQRDFIRCNNEQQTELIRQINQSRSGERWLSYLVTYLLEALLSDPVYGANPDGIGWLWLQHQPGFPQPPADKNYLKLLAKRHDGL